MTPQPTLTRRERFRQRRLDRRQRRAWRRERQKKHVNAYDAVNQAESSSYKGGFFTSGGG